MSWNLRTGASEFLGAHWCGIVEGALDLYGDRDFGGLGGLDSEWNLASHIIRNK